MDNKNFFIPIIVGTILFAAIVIFIIYFILLYRKGQQKIALERLHFKQTLLETEMEIREETLKNISLELHDNIGQIASLLKINLQMYANELSLSERGKISPSLELVRQLITDIKSLSADINAFNFKSIGLLQSLKNDCFRINRASVLTVGIMVEGELPEIKSDLEIIMYRMCQEILNNILQHSEASEAEISLKFENNIFYVILKDNGKGFDINQLEKTSFRYGLGLSNLSERARILGAILKIDSKIGHGTRIQIELPVN